MKYIKVIRQSQQIKVRVKQYGYRPGVTQRVPGS
jgi:hypothetical protein